MTEVFPPPPDRPTHRPLGDDWRRRQKELAAKQPALAVDSGTVTIGGPPLGHEVEVTGRDLHPALSPPEVTVGGVEVTDLQFSADGTSLRGRLRTPPPDARFVIDYGFARAEATLERRTEWWRWIRPGLVRAWDTVDRVVRWGISRLP